MHLWGEEGVDWGGIDEAARYIGDGLSRWARIHVSQTKEKYGTVRVYCSFGFDSFYGIWRPRHCWIPTWYPWRFDLWISQFVIPLVNLIVMPLQKKYYTHRYSQAVRKWPHLYKEILCDADWAELFEGTVPGFKYKDFFVQGDPYEGRP